jgi:hypothetical protein
MSNIARELAARYECVNCGYEVHFPKGENYGVCCICGVVNTKPEVKDSEGSGSWLPCIVPEGFLWEEVWGVVGPDVPQKKAKGKQCIDYEALPALPMTAKVLYRDSFGKEWTRADWIRRKMTDPAVQLRRQKETMPK